MWGSLKGAKSLSKMPSLSGEIVKESLREAKPLFNYFPPPLSKGGGLRGRVTFLESGIIPGAGQFSSVDRR